MTSNASVVESVLDWLRAGYPHGVPSEDKADAGVVITRLTDGMPLESDLVRVRDHLTAAGFPIDDNWLD